MPPSSESSKEQRIVLPSRDARYWSNAPDILIVEDVRQGVVCLNLNGRQLTGPLQGFGQLWQKTYRLRLPPGAATSTEVIQTLKQHLPAFQPSQNRFFPSVTGISPGEIVLINATLAGMPVNTGVSVLYADDVSFTLMTPQGHPESGFVTFSASTETSGTVAQIDSLARANDPVYELGFRLIGQRAQEAIWIYVLRALAAHLGVEASVDVSRVCHDPKCQWSRARNVWHNAMLRSWFYAQRTRLHRLRIPR
jgi:hypothetical protein